MANIGEFVIREATNKKGETFTIREFKLYPHIKVMIQNEDGSLKEVQYDTYTNKDGELKENRRIQLKEAITSLDGLLERGYITQVEYNDKLERVNRQGVKYFGVANISK